MNPNTVLLIGCFCLLTVAWYSIFTVKRQAVNQHIFTGQILSDQIIWTSVQRHNRNKSLKAVHDGTISSQIFICLEFTWGELYEISWRKSRSSSSSSRVLTSPSLSPPAAWATWAPPDRPPPLGCALPCRGRGCAGACGSWWTPTNTGMCASRGVPPAGHGSTFLPLPVGKIKWRSNDD